MSPRIDRPGRPLEAPSREPRTRSTDPGAFGLRLSGCQRRLTTMPSIVTGLPAEACWTFSTAVLTATGASIATTARYTDDGQPVVMVFNGVGLLSRKTLIVPQPVHRRITMPRWR